MPGPLTAHPVTTPEGTLSQVLRLRDERFVCRNATLAGRCAADCGVEGTISAERRFNGHH
jgi:hypothetical protein